MKAIYDWEVEIEKHARDEVPHPYAQLLKYYLGCPTQERPYNPSSRDRSKAVAHFFAYALWAQLSIDPGNDRRFSQEMVGRAQKPQAYVMRRVSCENDAPVRLC